ncbi:MAG: cache domain-containing protein [Elusimicrobia bacterium]|nr:cache domain-containing protein [Elusimicrobiota bacterium]
MVNKVRKIKIFYKFLLILLFLSVVPLGIVGWRLININRVNLQDVILELHTKQATSVADKIKSYMADLEEKLKFIISAHGEPPINWTLTQRILKSMIASSEDFITISTVNSDGRELTKVYSPSLKGKVKLESRKDDPAFLESLNTKELAVSPIYYAEKTPRINLVYPYTKEIYLYIEADMTELLETVRKSRIGKTGITYVVNNNSRIVMHPDIQLGVKRVSVKDRPIVQEVTANRFLGSKEYLNKQGKHIVGAYAPVPALDLGVIVEQDKNEAYLSVIKMKRNAIIFLIIVLLAACVAGYFMAQNLTSPIIKLTDTARNIATGDFNIGKITKWLKKVRLKDEVAELASTFIVMTQQLKRYNDMQADKMNAIIYSIADGIIMTDYSGKVILSNKKAKELLRIDYKKTLRGKKIQNIITRKEIADCLKVIRE